MIDRKTLKNKIKARKEAIVFEREQESVILANLGQAVFDSGLAADAPLSGRTRKITEVTDEIRKKEDALRVLLEKDDRRHFIQEEKKSLNVEIRNLRNKMEGVKADVGRGAWTLFKAGKFVHSNLEAALVNVVDAERRLHEAEDAYARSVNEGGGRVSSILARGKTFLMAGRKKSAAAALERQWERAGSRVMEMIPSEAFTGTAVAGVASIMQALQNRLEEANRRNDELTGELEEMDRAIEELPGNGSIKKRISQVEKALEEARDNLDEAYRVLGRDWVDSGASNPRKSEVEDRRAEWSALTARIAQYQSETDALNAHLEYMDVLDKADRYAARIAKLEEEIKSRQSSMKELKKDLSSLEKDLVARKEKLPQVPGDEVLLRRGNIS